MLMPDLQPQKPWGHAAECVAEPPILRLRTEDTRRGRGCPPAPHVPGRQSPAGLTDRTCAAAAAAFPSRGIDYGAVLSRHTSICSDINLGQAGPKTKG